MSAYTNTLVRRLQMLETELYRLRERVGSLEMELLELTADDADPHRELSPCCGFEVSTPEEFDYTDSEYDRKG